MDIRKLIGLNPEAANEGKWIEFIAGIKLKIARANNKRSRALTWELTRTNLKDAVGGTLSAEKAFEIDTQVLAQAILLDWSGLEYDGQNPFPYSKENAVKILSDKTMEIFRNRVEDEARNWDNFALEGEASAIEVLKNA